jgi:hypothetical protein
MKETSGWKVAANTMIVRAFRLGAESELQVQVTNVGTKDIHFFSADWLNKRKSHSSESSVTGSRHEFWFF